MVVERCRKETIAKSKRVLIIELVDRGIQGDELRQAGRGIA